MFKIFCCRSGNASRAEVDEITDSLEKCLSIERGVREFKQFLEKNNFKEECVTLSFAIKCQSISTEISRLSPFTRAMGLPSKIQTDIKSLYEMANDINFDLDQMNQLQNLFSPDTDSKINTLEMAQGWAVDLLQNIFRTYRRQALGTV